MPRRPPGTPRPSEITPERIFRARRDLLLGTLAAGAARLAPADGTPPPTLSYQRNARYGVADKPNTYEEITGYNNYYEFGTDKTDPAARAGAFRARPWSVAVAGEADVTGTFALEDLLRPHALQERIYRFRCVEAWSMVIPWVGIPLGEVLGRLRPTSRAKYVEFTTLLDPRQMPGQREPVLPWPYVEGLRIDEAMHPLSLLAVGVYGRELPNQNGAPLRLVVPWKYGFKCVKAIVRVRFTERQPANTWAVATPNEYGFYANVNPAVDHPRWSQASERRIGAGFFAARQPTLPFNGYAEEVAGLYRGMDLRRHF